MECRDVGSVLRAHEVDGEESEKVCNREGCENERVR